MNEEKINLAIDILAEKIADLSKEYANNQDDKLNDVLEEKIKILNEFKDKIYLGNVEYADKVIEKNKKGIL